MRFKEKKKFEDNVLVWCAISEAGVSHYAGDKIIFWPGLASYHYAKITRNWLEANNIQFVPKNDNPPNIPQARPIEDFWALLSRKVWMGSPQ